MTSKALLLAACFGLILCDVAAAGQRYFVERKFYCRSAEKADAGTKTILVEAVNCPAARHTIQAAVALELGDPCHEQNADTWLVRSEEIQVKSCPRQ